jgi:hydrogenase maturation protein HypF
MSTVSPPRAPRRVQVRVTGTVQGVGFRPHVYRLAGSLGLSGFVFNDAHGVQIEVEGQSASVTRFLHELEGEAPPLAALERVVVDEQTPTGALGFTILPSPQGERPDAAITPDTATCERCLQELFDPADRRFRYPFINCTDCGPRFTIVRGVPYDRPATTMAGFVMCPLCQREYENPLDRRFHAQPNACPACGPQVALLTAAGTAVGETGPRDPVQAAAQALREGAVVAVKGIGGYHLACRADDELAVARLRTSKHREDKPFALMAPSLARAAELVQLSPGEAELLRSVRRPIVLCARRASAPVAEAVAPGARELGVMLPYSPLHHLLLADAGTPLVMTSGNLSDEPIAHEDADARERLRDLADLFLVNDRPIETRTDDSVARVIHLDGVPRPAFMRRSRGFVPDSVSLPRGTVRPLLACGAELKNTFCVARGDHAWVSHHIGDLENWSTLQAFRTGIGHFERLFAVTPELVVHDLHPEYLSTKYALARDELEPVGVQHHHAHLAACLAEHREPGPALGVIFDGSGYGSDGTIWGGEFLYGDLAGFERVGMLMPVGLPGGERAIREPWRMACAWLAAAGDTAPEPPRSLRRAVQDERWRAVQSLLGRPTTAPLTSSIGRLFDAVAALCGIRSQVNYEGQAAIELERCCAEEERGAYPMSIGRVGGRLVLDPREMVRLVAADVDAGLGAAAVAGRFHTGLARSTVAAAAQAAAEQQTEVVVLSGGVFQNRRLLEGVAAGLSAAGLRVLFPRRLPPGDGAISYGQVAVAASRPGST